MFQSYARFFLVLVLGIGLASCNPYQREIPTGTSLRMDNVYAAPSFDYTRLVNVLILPVENPYLQRDIFESDRELAMALLRNWGKFNYFNVQFAADLDIPPSGVVNLETGAVNRLKLGAIGKDHNAQAILVVSIADFKPYFPMSMKLKAALIDVETGQRIWAFDKVFDTNDANVVNGMRTYWNTHLAGGESINRFISAKVRPSFFLNYSFYSMAETYGQARVDNACNVEWARACDCLEQEGIRASQRRAVQ